uniref:Replicase polyprotein 1ab n=1 Tax=Kibale red colobus virus 2 TaxID=1936072 RepID=X2D708_9NIDO|nr:polyprotein [Kibale red colobus virus 2]
MLTASGLTSDDRGGLVILPDRAKFITHHSHTRAWGDIDFKIVSPQEFDRTQRLSKSPQPCVAELSDGNKVIIRRHPPSLVDVICKGLDAVRQPAVHGPGDTGIDGYLWDFASPHSKEATFLSQQIITACEYRRGDAPNSLYPIHPVRGDPYREGSVLRNTRFGDIKTTTIADSNDPWLLTTAVNDKGYKVMSGEKYIANTLPFGAEVYVPTIPTTVLDYLDSRQDCPTYFTRHGVEEAALQDLAKFDLSTQGFVFPETFKIVRDYLIRVVGYQPAIYKPSNIPSNDSHAGVNGIKFSTKTYQSIPNIDQLCDRIVAEVWQSVTPVTLKKQYCSKQKTRTILGTNGLIALAIRAKLSGVTKAFQLAGEGSPICLGKSKFKRMDIKLGSKCLETDLASCDRSTPALVRWFTANLLCELGCCPEILPLYVANCCHDLLVTQTTATTKRGGLSSGDPVTSTSNTVYSLILYVQHMILSALKEGHPLSMRFLQGKLKFEDLLEVQPFIVYSDDLVLLEENPDLPNFKYWTEHLSLVLGFKVDEKKTVITSDPGFLGCHIVDGWLVSQRDRVLAALAYHMNAKDCQGYYQNAVAILSDASAMSVHDAEWFEELVLGLHDCATRDGYTFPGPPYFLDFFQKVSGYTPEAAKPCGVCGSTSSTVSSCGLRLCDLCSHRHDHCPVPSPFCKHIVGSKTCTQCSIDVVPGKTEFDELLREDEYQPPYIVSVEVKDHYTSAEPGRYVFRKAFYMLKKDKQGCYLPLPDGVYPMKKMPTTCNDINVPVAVSNAKNSKFVIGPPGAGKTTYIRSLLGDDDVVYCPTHCSLQAYTKAVERARFTIPPGQDASAYGVPSDSGPRLVLISMGYQPGRNHYVDEACYANPFDFLRLLSRTAVTCIGDPAQLAPVKFQKPIYLFHYMKQEHLSKIYRFGQNICDAIQPFYKFKLVSAKSEPTDVIYQSKFAPRGLVITPFHKDRTDDCKTIDSVQGITADIVTLYLPTPKSLTARRALVAISRAKHRLYIYDPHQQIEQFFNLPPLHTQILPVATVKQGVVEVHLNNDTVVPAISVPGMLVRAAPGSSAEKTLLEQSPLIVDFERSQISPLPRVGHNLGYYYSPDLVKFLPIPRELCPHWPVITAENNEAWSDRLVVSISRIHPLSVPAVNAGYYIGNSLFVGVPRVASYFLTRYVDGSVVEIAPTLFSTGRFEANLREYLDDDERQFANKHQHAFVGDTKGTTVGGCHHITSRYLPKEVPADAVVKVGVSKPGVAAKACCTITDIYLPALEPYSNPPTTSKVYKINVDNKPCRLMVWANATMYFQEHLDLTALYDASRFIQASNSAVVTLHPASLPCKINRAITTDPDLPTTIGITPWESNSDLLVSLAGPEPEFTRHFRLIKCIKYIQRDFLGTVYSNLFVYVKSNQSNTLTEQARILRNAPIFSPVKTSPIFHFNTTPCGCPWRVSVGSFSHCCCSSDPMPSSLICGDQCTRMCMEENEN